MHLLDIPTNTYLIYKPDDGSWIEADAEKTDVFPIFGSIIYRLQGLPILECEGLVHLMKVVDNFTLYSESDEGADNKSDGWDTSSIYSYPYDEEPDISDKEEGDKSDVDRDDIISSSQGSV